MKSKEYKTYGKNRSPRLAGFDYSTNRPYSITICTKEGIPVLKDDLALETVQCLRQLREQHCFRVFAYCVMIDHIHLLLAPGDSNLSISRIVQGFKSMSSRLYHSKGGHGKLWQRYFYDHIVRNDEDLKNVALYILENPARKGMVKDWQNYPYCGIIDKLQ